MRERATLRLDSAAELRVELDRDHLECEEIVLRRLESDRHLGNAVVGERPDMSDEERAKRLADLADLMFDPTSFDRNALKELESHEDDW